MSTGFVRIYTSKGFVVAADGRQCEGEDRHVVTDQVQKIFPIDEHGRCLAYAVVGTVGITSREDENKKGFEFTVETAKAVESMAGVGARDLTAYVQKISRSINMFLKDAKTSGRIECYPTYEIQRDGEPGHTIAKLYLDGYYKGLASSVSARFFHDNQRLSKPAIYLECLADMRIYGSSEVARLLFSTDDPRFAAYRRPRLNDPTLA